jgi:hypothetical protein
MAKGRERTEWDQTSLLAAIMANANRDPEKQSKAYTPLDFNPFADQYRKAGKQPPKKKYSMEQVKGLIMGSMGGHK